MRASSAALTTSALAALATTAAAAVIAAAFHLYRRHRCGRAPTLVLHPRLRRALRPVRRLVRRRAHLDRPEPDDAIALKALAPRLRGVPLLVVLGEGDRSKAAMASGLAAYGLDGGPTRVVQGRPSSSPYPASAIAAYAARRRLLRRGCRRRQRAGGGRAAPHRRRLPVDVRAAVRAAPSAAARARRPPRRAARQGRRGVRLVQLRRLPQGAPRRRPDADGGSGAGGAERAASRDARVPVGSSARPPSGATRRSKRDTPSGRRWRRTRGSPRWSRGGTAGRLASAATRWRLGWRRLRGACVDAAPDLGALRALDFEKLDKKAKILRSIVDADGRQTCFADTLVAAALVDDGGGALAPYYAKLAPADGGAPTAEPARARSARSPPTRARRRRRSRAPRAACSAPRWRRTASVASRATSGS